MILEDVVGTRGKGRRCGIVDRVLFVGSQGEITIKPVSYANVVRVLCYIVKIKF